MKTYKEFSLQIMEAAEKPKEVPKDSVQDDLDDLKDMLGDDVVGTKGIKTTLKSGKKFEVSFDEILKLNNLKEEYLEENSIMNWLDRKGIRTSADKREAYDILNKVYKAMLALEKKKQSKKVSYKKENEIAYRENRKAEAERRIQQNRSARARLANSHEKLPSTKNKQLVGGKRL